LEGASNAAINEHIEAVRMLVQGMDAKLAAREAKISKEMARAEDEAQRAATARKKMGV
jgi:chorismate synthase